ncbi:aspartate--tRNA(Asn) ligase [Candidatus Micrarchaeota archaeon CG10_big_fil_rev_8_21_14_0_10_45_29]|nr:MAG: aspartate--tRNA(Asn) ligase [Candidatus Micrarchaeota archaeon CG10_big_fil_rev_8_21_14_0_10_45_29]
MLRTHYIKDAKDAIGKSVTIAGWAHEVRDKGKMKFLLLRDKTGIVQIFAKQGDVPEEVFSALSCPKETVLLIEGQVKESKIAKSGIEIIPSKVQVLAELSAKVPFDITEKVPAELDTRLDHRYVDLRKPEVNAIFKIKSHAIGAFRNYLSSQGFDEIHPTCIVSAATEGGAELFELQYFEKKAYLAQSPQLYKQMAVIGGMDKVFMTSPVFRAEKHNTTTHLNEVLQMDVEMGFCVENDALDALEKTFLSILGEISKNCASELEILGAKLNVPKKIPRHTYSSLVDKLNSDGMKMQWGEDFSREHEARVCEILDEEAYLITGWPTKIRAFYSMPDEKNPQICKAYDLVYKGLEISSGAQRIHIPELLEKQLKFHNCNPADFKFYIDAFRVGAPPHAGWSIGLERLVMKICGLSNIREATLFPRDRHRISP